MPASNLHIEDLGCMGYVDALGCQRRVHQSVLDHAQPDTLLLLEHDPVITVSGRKGAGDHLLATKTQLATLGIDVHETDRGGDVTYHGPGQLVAYLMIRLSDHGLNVSRYVAMLEQIVIDTVSQFGITADRDRCARGVWVADAKLGAVGVRIKKNVSMHGLALNVTTNLTHFKTIVPCGLPGRDVTSMQRLLGDHCPTVAQVKQVLTDVTRGCLT